MIDIAGSQSIREWMSEALSKLIDNAIQSGWPEHDVALLLMELAEDHFMRVTAGVIIEDALYSQRAANIKN
jgi:hypothetical protein